MSVSMVMCGTVKYDDKTRLLDKMWLATLPKEATLSFLPPFSMGINSLRKKFAPLGEISSV